MHQRARRGSDELAYDTVIGREFARPPGAVTVNSARAWPLGGFGDVDTFTSSKRVECTGQIGQSEPAIRDNGFMGSSAATI